VCKSLEDEDNGLNEQRPKRTASVGRKACKMTTQTHINLQHKHKDNFTYQAHEKHHKLQQMQDMSAV
jgi:hypothetical protein